MGKDPLSNMHSQCLRCEDPTRDMITHNVVKEIAIFALNVISGGDIIDDMLVPVIVEPSNCRNARRAGYVLQVCRTFPSFRCRSSSFRCRRKQVLYCESVQSLKFKLSR